MELTLSKEDKKEIQEIMFCTQLTQNKDALRLNTYVRKKFDIVGCVAGKFEKSRKCGRFSRAVEVSLMNTGRDKIMVCFDGNAELEGVRLEQLVKITRLRLYPFDQMLMLAASDKTAVLSLVPDVLTSKAITNTRGKLDRVLSTPKSRKVSGFCVEVAEVAEPMWPVLSIDLGRYAQSTENGIRFSLKALMNISDRVNFIGIVVGIENKQNSYGSVAVVRLRDIITNDSVNVLVFYSGKKKEQKEFIGGIREYFVIRISGYRMVAVI